MLCNDCGRILTATECVHEKLFGGRGIPVCPTCGEPVSDDDEAGCDPCHVWPVDHGEPVG